VVVLAIAERVRVFWQPGCTSCLRTKEFLTRHGVDYESINVHGNDAAMADLPGLPLPEKAWDED
jgi:arsenate reductase-like glutaredoxin family protein